MDQKEVLKALRHLKVETGSLACLGCGHENSCSTRGCAVIREAIEALEETRTTGDCISRQAAIDRFMPYVHVDEKIPAETVIEELHMFPAVDMQEAQWRWIPCSSGVMPNAEQEVRVICKTSTGYKYQCQAFYVPAGVYREDSGYSWDWECCEEYDEERDDYMVNPGWYESIHNWDDYNAVGISDTVTHWMPLPQPPKEVSDNG